MHISDLIFVRRFPTTTEIAVAAAIWFGVFAYLSLLAFNAGGAGALAGIAFFAVTAPAVIAHLYRLAMMDNKQARKPTMAEVEIRLSNQVDGFGFLYGESRWRDTTVRLNVMPPAPLFRADLDMPDCRPHATRWRVWADGEEIGSLDATREELIPALERLLMFGEGGRE